MRQRDQAFTGPNIKPSPGHGSHGLRLRMKAKPIKLFYARAMRLAPTLAEAHLWEHLKSSRLGFKFRRQAIVRGWIVDFWCPKCRLVVEVDGGYHSTAAQTEADNHRDRVMTSLGLTVLRLPNELVIQSTDVATTRIFQAACEGLRKKTLQPPRRGL